MCEFPPENAAFLLMDRERGLAVPVDCLSVEDWERLQGEILRSVGRGVSDWYRQKSRCKDGKDMV